MYFLRKYIETIIARNSANGTDNHTPFTPKTNGNVKTEITTKTKVLKNDITAEILPFEKAVNNEELNKFNPMNKNAKENNLTALMPRA